MAMKTRTSSISVWVNWSNVNCTLLTLQFLGGLVNVVWFLWTVGGGTWYLLLIEFEIPTALRTESFSASIYGPNSSHLGLKIQEKRGSVTSVRIKKARFVSYLLHLHCMSNALGNDSSSGGMYPKFSRTSKGKKSEFEIVVESWERFCTQFKIWEGFKLLLLLANKWRNSLSSDWFIDLFEFAVIVKLWLHWFRVCDS